MPRVVEVTLAKALKLKKRLAGRIDRLQGQIVQHNSTLVGSERPIDIERSLERLVQMKGALTRLKAAISVVNQPIYALIFEQAEARGFSQFMGGLNTTHGRVLNRTWMSDGNVEKPVEHEAIIREGRANKLAEGVEERIDEIQDELDTFNGKTSLEIYEEVIKFCRNESEVD